MLPEIKVMYDVKLCTKCGRCAVAVPSGSVAVTENILRMVDGCPYEAYVRSGDVVSSDMLAEKLLRDKVFYQNSGGGVTFSGGEPLLQYQFVLETARKLEENGVHVALDTAGLWDFDAVYPLLDIVDLVLFDIKAVDSSIHRRCTGVPNEQILQNANELARIGKPMLARMIVVPTQNDMPDDVAARLDFIKGLGPCVQRVDILKYHGLGEGKYLQLGIEYPAAGIPACTDEAVESICEMAMDRGLVVAVGG